eukprot:m.1432859 g.1432859  ORF g.1432859 m.1432859 type:complete len:1649 (+) comp25078_c0_seq3:350-5296(+)
MASPIPDGVAGDAKKVLAQQVSMLSPTQPVHVHSSPALRRRTMSASGKKDKVPEKKPEKTFSNLLRLIPGADGSPTCSPLGTPNGKSTSPSSSSSGGKKAKSNKRRSVLAQDVENYTPGTPEVKRRNKNTSWLLKYHNVATAFGKNLHDSGTAQKALWLGSTVLRGKDTSYSHAWDAVRGVLRHGTREATKVYIVASQRCIGAVEAKIPHFGRKGPSLPMIHLKEDPENVTKVLSEHDSTDGMLIAYVTESNFLKFNHVHVFGMKREEDGYDIVTAMRKICDLTGDVGRLYKAPRARHRPDSHASDASDTHEDDTEHDRDASVGQTETLLVEFLGEAMVSSEAWWRRSDAVLGDKHQPLNKQDTTSTFKRCVSFYGELLVRPEALTAAEAALFSEEVALVVRSDRVVVYSLLTQEALVTISTSAIKAVRKGDFPEHVYEELDPAPLPSGAGGGTAAPIDAISVGTLQLSEQQRVAVMASVKAGQVSVADAMEIALEAENKVRQDARMKVISICFADDQVGSSTVVSLLVRGLRAADAVVAALATARKNAKIANSDPFAPFGGNSADPSTRRQSTEKLLEYELDRDALTAVEHLGNGEFGEVYLANHVVGTKEAQDGEEVDVEEKRAVKTLRPDLPTHITKTFGNEALLHVKLKHKNIVNVVGVCMAQQPYLVVLEYCMYGDLRKVLKTIKRQEIELSLGEQTHILGQIADAMAYVTKARIAHMDLASRNVLVHQGTTMKVADFGLAHRYSKKKDHYALRGKIRLPFLWVPPECLPCAMWDASVTTPYEPLFNEQTDMWSFGVLIWEVLNYGEIPYNFGENLKPILEKIYNGLRLDPPYQCHSVFKSALTRTFAARGQRPTFVQLKSEFEAVLNDPDQNLHGVRDLGKLLNAPLESNVEKLTQIVSLRRRHSKALLQMRERRKSQADFDPTQMSAVVQRIQHEEAAVARELAASPIGSVSAVATPPAPDTGSLPAITDDPSDLEPRSGSPIAAARDSSDSSFDPIAGCPSDSSQEIVRGFGSDASLESPNPCTSDDGGFVDATRFFADGDGDDLDADVFATDAGSLPQTPRSRQRRPSEVVFDPSMWALSPEGKLVRGPPSADSQPLQEPMDDHKPHNDPTRSTLHPEDEDAYLDVGINEHDALEEPARETLPSVSDESDVAAVQPTTTPSGGSNADGHDRRKPGPPVAQKTKPMPAAKCVKPVPDAVQPFNFKEYVDYYSSSDDEESASPGATEPLTDDVGFVPSPLSATSGASDLEDSFTAALKSEVDQMEEEDQRQTGARGAPTTRTEEAASDLSGRQRSSRGSVRLMSPVLSAIGTISPVDPDTSSGVSADGPACTATIDSAVVSEVANEAIQAAATQAAASDSVEIVTSQSSAIDDTSVVSGTTVGDTALKTAISDGVESIGSAEAVSSNASEDAIVPDATSPVGDKYIASDGTIHDNTVPIDVLKEATVTDITISDGNETAASDAVVTDGTVTHEAADGTTTIATCASEADVCAYAVTPSHANDNPSATALDGAADTGTDAVIASPGCVDPIQPDPTNANPSNTNGEHVPTEETLVMSSATTNSESRSCETAAPDSNSDSVFPHSMSLDAEKHTPMDASRTPSVNADGGDHVTRSVSEDAVKRKARRTNRLQSILDSLGHSDI